MNENEYNVAFERVKDAFESGNDEEILKSVENYYEVWNKNAGENQFYNMKDYREVVLRLGNMLLTKDLAQATHYKGIVEMLPVDVLTRALFKNNKDMTDAEFDKVQQYIVDNGSNEDKIQLAGLLRADFEKIEDSIIKTTDSAAMQELYENYPKRANIGKLYARVNHLMQHSPSKQAAKHIAHRAMMKKYYDAYKAKQQEEFETNNIYNK